MTERRTPSEVKKVSELTEMKEGDLRIMLCDNPDHPFHVWSASAMVEGGHVEFRPVPDSDPIAQAIIDAAIEHVMPRFKTAEEIEELEKLNDGPLQLP